MRIFLFFLILCVAFSSPKAIVKRAEESSGLNAKNIAKVGAISAGAGILAFAGYQGIKHFLNRGKTNNANNENIHAGDSSDEPVAEKIHH